LAALTRRHTSLRVSAAAATSRATAATSRTAVGQAAITSSDVLLPCVANAPGKGEGLH